MCHDFFVVVGLAAVGVAIGVGVGVNVAAYIGVVSGVGAHYGLEREVKMVVPDGRQIPSTQCWF